MEALNQEFFSVARQAQEVVVIHGGTIYQKWTCLKCGERVMMEEPDKFFTRGYHDACGYTTDLVETGCGFLAVYKRERR